MVEETRRHTLGNRAGEVLRPLRPPSIGGGSPVSPRRRELMRRERLLARAPPGGPSADYSMRHRGAVPRAHAAWVAGRDDVAGVRTALGDGRLQHRLQRAIEA